MSKDEPLLSNCPLETAEPSRNYARVPGYKKKIQEKDKKRTRKEKKNERRRNQYARVRRYKITSTLGLLVRGDPQNEGFRGLQPRALGSKLDYFHAGITSTRLHRPDRPLQLAPGARRSAWATQPDQKNRLGDELRATVRTEMVDWALGRGRTDKGKKQAKEAARTNQRKTKEENASWPILDFSILGFFLIKL